MCHVVRELAPPLPRKSTLDSKVHEANMGPNWGRQDPGGPHVGPMNLAIWVIVTASQIYYWGQVAASVSE